jgi:hypothetical protein
MFVGPVAETEKQNIRALSLLTLNPAHAEAAAHHVAGLSRSQRVELLALAESHHVVIRAFQVIQERAAAEGNSELEQWAATTLAGERARIQNALQWLERVCDELERAGCPVAVMKSLDHWPDLGSDLDLFTTGELRRFTKVFTSVLKAHTEARSWGDRLANKWNFAVPGLRELVEVHAHRLGQTGEHIALARRFITRRVPIQVDNYTFLVPAPEERVIVATLQRMYRHFYFRVCDMVNTAALVESHALDYAELRKAADMGGIWPGVASYLTIVCDYVQQYRGVGLELPSEVRASAPFGGDRIFMRDRFIRVPIVPDGAKLYTQQITTAALRGDVPATFRLSLLPPLASAAALAYRIRGSDKGIW